MQDETAEITDATVTQGQLFGFPSTARWAWRAGCVTR